MRKHDHTGNYDFKDLTDMTAEDSGWQLTPGHSIECTFMYFYSPLDGMQVHHGATPSPSINFPVPISTTQ